MDNDGRVDWHEFYTAVIDYNNANVFSDQNRNMIFNTLDRHSDNYFDIEDLKKILNTNLNKEGLQTGNLE